MCVCASILTITAMAVDRYLAITQPLGFPRWFNRTSTKAVILLLWLASAAAFSPMLVVARTFTVDLPPLAGHLQPVRLAFCSENWTALAGADAVTVRRYVTGFWFCVTYLVPGATMAVCYALMGRTLCSVRPPFDRHGGGASTQQGYRLVRERRRVAFILLLLAVVFCLCWMPYSVFSLLVDAELVPMGGANRATPYLLLLGHANSALNPIIYCFMTKNFRRSVKELAYHARHATCLSTPSNRLHCQVRAIPLS